LIEVRWSDQSLQDLSDLLDLYDRIDPELAERVEQTVRSAPALLSRHPLAGPSIGDSHFRKWPVRNLPLLLLYRFVNECIEIDRIVHQKQNWREGR
jgi:toxin ParE1/3/4